MKPISPEYRHFVHERAPRFVQALQAARQKSEPAPVALEDFEDNPFLLYAALWYAACEGFDVLLTPVHTIPKHSRTIPA